MHVASMVYSNLCLTVYTCIYAFSIVTVQTTDGCQAEIDENWLLLWPLTPVGSFAIQKCSGTDSIG